MLNPKIMDQTESKEFVKKDSKYHLKKEDFNLLLDKYKALIKLQY